MVTGAHQADAGHCQNATKHVHHPVELLEQRASDKNEDRTHDQGAGDPPEQHPVLITVGDAEPGKNHDEHEDVVDRQSGLDDVPGRELQCPFTSEPPPHQPVERHGTPKAHPAPNGCLPYRYRVSSSVEYAKVGCKHCQDKCNEAPPEDWASDRFGFHGLPFGPREPRMGRRDRTGLFSRTRVHDPVSRHRSSENRPTEANRVSALPDWTAVTTRAPTEEANLETVIPRRVRAKVSFARH